jgi:hypothetical protein
MRLYNFLSIEHAIDDLVKRRIKISTYDDMNDPYELGGVKLVANKLTPDDCQMVLRDIRLAAKEGGVICFSETFSQPLLWSHYADKHKGCCLAFDVEEGEHLHPVQLCTDFLEISIDHLHVFWDIKAKGGSVASLHDPQFEELIAKQNEVTKAVMLAKYKKWEYEKERRVWIELKPEQKDGKFYFAEFEGRLKPVEVLLGARCTTDDESKFYDAVHKYDPPLPIFRTALSSDKFEIVKK